MNDTSKSKERQTKEEILHRHFPQYKNQIKGNVDNADFLLDRRSLMAMQEYADQEVSRALQQREEPWVRVEDGKLLEMADSLADALADSLNVIKKRIGPVKCDRLTEYLKWRESNRSNENVAREIDAVLESLPPSPPKD